MDYEKSFILGDLVKGRRTFNNEVVEGKFNGFYLHDKLDPTSVVGVIFVEDDRCYDVFVGSIELLESKDERIRKEIIAYLDVQDAISDRNDRDFKRWIAWLEKQCEQKLNWEIVKKKAYKIAWETSKHYNPLLCKEAWCEMAAIDMASWLEKQGKQKEILCDKCRKEQCDMLFQKMKEMGYEWDSEKKELKKIDDEWVDLGLPSRTLWKDKNEEGLYTYDEAVDTFSNQLPTKEQFEELKSLCKWEWKGNCYKVIGPNGNSIFMPAMGYRNCDGDVFYVGSYGNYWSFTPDGSDYAWGLYFGSSGVGMLNFYRCIGRSVRLVKPNK